MPISTKIIDEIEKLPIKREEQELMKDLLSLEDGHGYKINKAYTDDIESYLKNHLNDEEGL
jgi:hypothetical protein